MHFLSVENRLADLIKVAGNKKYATEGQKMRVSTMVAGQLRTLLAHSQMHPLMKEKSMFEKEETTENKLNKSFQVFESIWPSTYTL